uniref:CSON008208 protein n=1 Tax=Culicoides sonorensis TaxID=179676 RepID=A0A336MAN0_CULSO
MFTKTFIVLISVSLALGAVISIQDVDENDKVCAKVGQPCYENTDCCSNVCPFYWKKCVSTFKDAEENESNILHGTVEIEPKVIPV